MNLSSLKLKIRHKLFLAILIANSLLLGTIYMFGSWIFNTSFDDYLNQTEATRLAPLAQELAAEYSRRGNWRWLRNRQDPTWHQLASQYSPQTNRRRPLRINDSGQNRLRPEVDGNRPPPPGGRPGPDRPPLLVLGQNQQLVIGRPQDVAQAYWIPISQDSTMIGQLGFLRRIDITSELDILFAERIRNNFSWMILGILFISIIIALPLSRFLVRPIEQLKLAMHALASGNSVTSLAHKGSDEFAELVTDFNALSQTLDKNSKLRQQWIADISHELRTPVSVLQGELEAIQDGIRNLDQPAVESLHQEALRLSRLVNDLHELSLSDIGALSYQKSSVNIAGLIEDIVDQQGELLKAQSIHVSLSMRDEKNAGGFIINGDFRRLEQLFTNLANNSRHYTQPPGNLEISIQSKVDYLIITWSDSAPGASDNDLEHLFDRLFRIETSRNRNTGGSGLGLAICQNIVLAHQGSIKAQHSTLGGISIVITFPLLVG
ncbi:MAG: two-component system sensor histidine kinase BaeS [Gammaproteobacteria bacterium]|jgi:two-component system sensor histidine kinase BaeS